MFPARLHPNGWTPRHVAVCSMVLGTLAAACPCRATVGPPIKVRFGGDPQPARAGQHYAGVLEIITREAPAKVPELTNLQIAPSKGWRNPVLQLPPVAKMSAGGTLRVPFAVDVLDPNEPLVVQLDVGGRPYQKVFHLSEESFRQLREPGRLVQLPEGALIPFPGIDHSRPIAPLPAAPPPPKDPRPGVVRPEGLEDPNDPPLPERSRRITVQGRFTYRRPDGQVVGVDGAAARVYDDDWCCDELLGSQATDPNGYFSIQFDWDPCWTCDGQPDIYVDFETDTAVVQTQTDDVLETDYTYETGTWGDYGGSFLDVGWVLPDNPNRMPPLSIQTDITRAWRYILVDQGRNVPQVDVQWASGDNGAYYNDLFEEIHISTQRTWDEFTYIHEYGHHFVNNFAILNSPDYCNGICDTAFYDWWPFQYCGHCAWCRETNHDAFNEGFPSWVAEVIWSSFAPDYGLTPLPRFNPADSYESLQNCSDGTLHDPWITEGPFTAALLDISDSNQDDEPAQPAGMDELALGAQDIFNLVGWDAPTNPADFFNKFRARWPQRTEQLWATAKNNGYELDQFPPGVATALACPSHDLCFNCANPYVDFSWQRAPDDCSGIGGYSVVLALSLTPPDQTAEIGDVGGWHSGIMPAGAYWFTIRAVDRAGRWSPNYATYGPVTIRPPEPADLGWNLPFDWYGAVVPSPLPNAQWGSVSWPASLPGNHPAYEGDPEGTWVNVAGYNFGDLPASSWFGVGIYVDGTYTTGALVPPTAGFTPYRWNNGGPFLVRGGRHTLGVRHDQTNLIAEGNEYNNTWAHQYAWSASPIGAGVPISRAAPPNRVAGWDWVIDGSPLWFNSDAVQYSPVTWWTALVGGAVDNNDDYDLFLYPASGGGTSGYDASYYGFSAHNRGMLDALIVNSNTMGWGAWDVAVENYSGGSSDSRVLQVGNAEMPFNASGATAFGQGEMLKLWEIYVPGPGPVTAALALEATATQPVYAAWYDQGFTTGGLSSATAIAAVTPGTAVHLDVSAGTAGFYCLALSRDPVNGTAPFTLSMSVRTTPPDYQASTIGFPGWYAPLVPEPTPSGTLLSVPQPGSLPGDVASTYFNVVVRNESPAVAPAFFTNLYLDGVYGWWLYWDSAFPHSSNWLNWTTAWTIPGGRHTLAMLADPGNGVLELDESNNTNGQQWVWTPSVLAARTPVSRGAPGSRTGGWSQVTTGEVLWFDCDGLRTPIVKGNASGNGYWGAVAIMPLAGDVDVHLHERSTGAKSGFASPLRSSLWGINRSDYVLVDERITVPRAFEVGMTSAEPPTGTTNYVAEYVPSVTLGTAPATLTPPATLPAGRILDLYEIYFPIGAFDVRLINIAGSVNWGMTVHPADQPFQSKSTAVAEGLQDIYGPGMDESARLTISTAGSYAIAVWKSSATDLPLVGTYQLVVSSGATDVAGGAPAPRVTALAAVHPNPFNPRTTIEFDLAAAEDVTLAIFTLRGERVATLVSGTRPAGRQQVVWDGTDDRGAAVASGVYAVRLQGRDVTDVRKVVLAR